MSKRVIRLNSPESETRMSTVGGKAANLAAMLRAGLPVPPGFVITTGAFHEFIRANGLSEMLRGRKSTKPLGAPASSVISAKTVQQLFMRGSIPKEIEQDIFREYRCLSDAVRARLSQVDRESESSNSGWAELPVAVRSSATIEDSAHVSFAGGLATYLNIRGGAAVVELVLRIWSSLWSERAIDYLLRRGIDPATVSLAVVVQQMVHADCAGVLFTINPITGNRDEAVINAESGLGDDVVSGRITPDFIVVDKATHRVKQVVVGEKRHVTVIPAEDAKEVPAKLRKSAAPVLSREQISALIDIGCEIEAHFGCSQDVEWCFVDKNIRILQSRPVTNSALAGPDADADVHAPGDDCWLASGELTPQEFDLWTRVNVGEIWPCPVTPLMWSGVPFILDTTARYALRGLSAYIDEIQWVKRFYGRVYYNEGAISYLLSRELGLPASFVDRALGCRRGVILRQEERVRPKQFLKRLPFVLRIMLSQLRPGAPLGDLVPRMDAWVACFMRRSLDGLSDSELWSELNTWATRFVHLTKVIAELNISSMLMFGLLEQLTSVWCGRKNLAHELVTGISGIHSIEMGIALWQIGQWLSCAALADVVLRNEPKIALMKLRQMPEARPLIRMLDSFLQRHGHHCPNEGEWLHPRWVDAPEQILTLVAGYLKAGEQVDVSRVETQRRRREEAVACLRRNLDPVRWPLFRLILIRTQQLVRLRENGKDCYMKALYPLRRIYSVFGHRWARIGWLKRADDIFFLTNPEVELIVQSGGLTACGLDISTLVDERRKAFDYWATVEAPDVIDSNGQRIEMRAADEPIRPALQGIPVSSGRVQGAARIIDTPDEAHKLQPGDILVTRATDPGWTPLFPLVSGLIVEIGGQLSHASIVAREYGLPAVANVRNARRRLRNGQRITVDGTAGYIYLDDKLCSEAE